MRRWERSTTRPLTATPSLLSSTSSPAVAISCFKIGLVPLGQPPAARYPLTRPRAASAPSRQMTTKSALLADLPRKVLYSPNGADPVQLIRIGAAALPQTIVEAAAITTTARMLLAVVRAQRPRSVLRWLLGIALDAPIPAEPAASGVPS